MKRLTFLMAAMALGACPVHSQDPTAADPNEGSRLIQTSPTTFSFKWWGRSGKSYFVQQTDDLLTSWHYLPVVGTGGDDIISLGMNAPNSDKLFLRLEILSYDPYATDTDGDGAVDAYEIFNSLNHRTADGLGDLDGDGISNQEDARPNDAAFGRVSITITTPTNGSTIN